MNADIAYNLGRLLAMLEHEGAGPGSGIAYMRVTERPYEFTPMIEKLNAMGRGGTIKGILQGVPSDVFNDDNPLDAEALGSFGIGYYHQKAELRKSS